MAWTTPPTWVALDVLTHTQLNTYLSDNLTVLSTHGHTGAAGDGAVLDPGEHLVYAGLMSQRPITRVGVF